jgi:hypothetical protein
MSGVVYVVNEASRCVSGLPSGLVAEPSEPESSSG